MLSLLYSKQDCLQILLVFLRNFKTVVRRSDIGGYGLVRFNIRVLQKNFRMQFNVIKLQVLVQNLIIDTVEYQLEQVIRLLLSVGELIPLEVLNVVQ